MGDVAAPAWDGIVDGMRFPVGEGSELSAYLWMFGNGKVKNGGADPILPEDRFRYFKRAVDIVFNNEDSICNIVWTPWADFIIRELIGDWSHKRLVGCAGASSSGKSHIVALYGLMAYWANPTETYFIVMSTTKDAARTRIWKSITQLWGQASRMGAPGKLIDSNGYIKGLSKKLELDRNSGVLLKPAGKLSDDASAELLGIKNPNVIVAADEMNHLTDGILKTAYENMTSNDRLLFVGMANPDKLTDPFGQLCEPKGGWKSVTEDDERWETNYGTCIRLNAEKSPAILEPEKYGHLTWMTNQSYCDRIAKQRGGTKSAGYYRFVKAFWCPDGASNTVYSELELLEALQENEPAWDAVPITIGSLDESFSRDGDQSFAAIGRLGKVSGRDHLHVCCEKPISEDTTNKETPHTFQIARGWKALCEDFGVKPHRAILDNTGGGTAFGHIVDMEWSPAVQKVNFQGKASERTIVFRNEDCGFYNKNSEMWIQPKEYIRSGQITGLSRETMAEMVDREYHPKEGRTLRVESKEEAKKRLKKSPDRADAFNMLVEKAITLGAFKSEEVKKVSKMANKGWEKMRDKRQLATTCGRRFR
jgi:hypothetical protein